MSISVKKLTHIYNPSTPFESKALENVSFEIETGEFVGLIGHTGSGKSTLIQHLNGLLKASSGEIKINDFEIKSDSKNLSELRKKVGLVFQYPEYQLFEETIEKDIAFGPSNLGLGEEEIKNRVKESMEIVGLSYEKLKDRSPFDLSGGQRRRVAIAGVIAMKPDLLILDEPTAGLDPKGREEILSQIKKFHEKYKITIILVSHSMDDVAELANKLMVMNKGKLEIMSTPKEVFKQSEKLKEMGLGIPAVLELTNRLREKGINIDNDIITLQEAKEQIIKLIGRDKSC